MKLIPYSVAAAASVWAWPVSTATDSVYAQLFALSLVILVGFDAVTSAINEASKEKSNG